MRERKRVNSLSFHLCASFLSKYPFHLFSSELLPKIIQKYDSIWRGRTGIYYLDGFDRLKPFLVDKDIKIVYVCWEKVPRVLLACRPGSIRSTGAAAWQSTSIPEPKLKLCPRHPLRGQLHSRLVFLSVLPFFSPVLRNVSLTWTFFKSRSKPD